MIESISRIYHIWIYTSIFKLVIMVKINILSMLLFTISSLFYSIFVTWFFNLLESLLSHHLLFLTLISNRLHLHTTILRRLLSGCKMITWWYNFGQLCYKFLSSSFLFKFLCSSLLLIFLLLLLVYSSASIEITVAAVAAAVLMVAVSDRHLDPYIPVPQFDVINISHPLLFSTISWIRFNFFHDCCSC